MDYPGPFLKWAGGKTQLLDELLYLIPHTWIDNRRKWRRYHEPFLGAGALYFALYRLFGDRLVAHLGDDNRDLMEAWTGVMVEPDLVAAWIDAQGTTRADYYRIRAMRPETAVLLELLAERAARTIYLNKTCWNGLYRTGPDFMDPELKVFNVPWGKRESVTIYDPENFAAFGKMARMPLAFTRDFWQCERDVLEGDLVYFDPPYVPVKRTSKTDYGSGAFGYDEHERLAELFDMLVTKRGAHCLLSNADTPWVRDRYRAHYLHPVKGRRSINSDGEGRGPVGEVIVVGR